MHTHRPTTLYCATCRSEFTTTDAAQPPYAAVHTPDGHLHPIARTPLQAVTS